jgi:hypothetical protein
VFGSMRSSLVINVLLFSGNDRYTKKKELKRIKKRQSKASARRQRRDGCDVHPPNDCPKFLYFSKPMTPSDEKVIKIIILAQLTERSSRSRECLTMKQAPTRFFLRVFPDLISLPIARSLGIDLEISRPNE